MKINNVSKNNIGSLLQEFEEYIIYYFDKLEAGKEKINVDLENINEAFFFNSTKCLHIYREDEIRGILYEEEGNEEVLIEEQLVEYRKLIKKLKVKKYIEYEQDGQAYISRTLPSKLVFQEVE